MPTDQVRGLKAPDKSPQNLDISANLSNSAVSRLTSGNNSGNNDARLTGVENMARPGKYPPYIQLREEGFRVNVQVPPKPPELRKTLGKSRFVHTLKTHCLQVAITRGAPIIAEFLARIEAARP